MLIRLGIFASILHIFGRVVSHKNEVVFHRKRGRFLGTHSVKISKTGSELDCGYACAEELECVSANFKVKGEDEGLCVLNSRSFDELPKEVGSDEEYVYLAVIMRVRNDAHLAENFTILESFSRVCVQEKCPIEKFYHGSASSSI